MYKKIFPILLLISILFTYGLAQKESKQDQINKLSADLEVNLKKEDFKKVIEISNSILEIAPNSPDIYFTRGLSFFKLENHEKAIADLEKALVLGLDSKSKISAYQLKALGFFNLNEFQKAINDFDLLLQVASNDHRGFGLRGISHFRLKNYELAIKDFDKSLKIMPGQAGLHRFSGIAKYNIGKYRSAIEDLNVAIKSEPQVMESYKFREKSYRKLGEVELADIDLDVFTKYLVGQINKHIDTNNYDSAIKRAVELTEFLPGEETRNLLSTTYAYRGLGFLNDGENEKALKDFAKTVETNPNTSLGFYGRAKTLNKLNRFDEALLDAKKVLEIEPDHKGIYSVLSEIYFYQKKFEESIKSANFVLAEIKGDIDAIRYRGLSLVKLNRNLEALKDFDFLLDKYPKDVEIFFNRILANSGLGRWEDVRSDSLSILNLESKNYLALTFKAAANFALQENLPSIVEDITNIEKADPELMNAQLYSMRAHIHRTNGNIELAEADEKKAEALEKTSKEK